MAKGGGAKLQLLDAIQDVQGGVGGGHCNVNNGATGISFGTWTDDQPLGQRKFDGLGYGAMFDKPSHAALRRRLRQLEVNFSHHKAMA